MATSRKKTAANRTNSTKSTGPRTSRGKQAAARNATKHGILSMVMAIREAESAEEWADFLGGMLESLGPEGSLETTLAHNITSTLWRLRRVARFELQTIEHQLDNAPEDYQLIVKGLDPERKDLGAIQPSATAHSKAEEQLQLAEYTLTNSRQLSELKDEDLVDDDDAHSMIYVIGHGLELKPGSLAEILAEPRIRRLIPPEGSKWRGKKVKAVIRKIISEVDESQESLNDLSDLFQRIEIKVQFEHHFARMIFENHERRLREICTARLLPEEAAMEKIMRYEAHLHRRFTRDLHELQRLQASRLTGTMCPPAALDIGITAHRVGK